MVAAYGSYGAYPAKGNAPELLTRTTVIKGNLGARSSLNSRCRCSSGSCAGALQPCLNPLARRLGLRCRSLGLCEGCGLSAPRQHLDGAADLLVASDHRVELALAGRLGEVA